MLTIAIVAPADLTAKVCIYQKALGDGELCVKSRRGRRRGVISPEHTGVHGYICVRSAERTLAPLTNEPCFPSKARTHKSRRDGRKYIFINQGTMVHSLVKGNATHAIPPAESGGGGGGVLEADASLMRYPSGPSRRSPSLKE